MSDHSGLSPLATESSNSVLVLDDASPSLISERLEQAGFSARRSIQGQERLAMVGASRPLAIVVGFKGDAASSDRSIQELIALKRRFAIPLLVVIDRPETLNAAPRLISEADDWLFAERLEQELVLRFNRLVAKRLSRESEGRTSMTSATDPRFYSLVSHDLRTPLYVIGLSLRMISVAMPSADPEVLEDFRNIEENLGVIERALAQLSDYFGLIESGISFAPRPFDPRRLVEELLATRPDKPATRFGKVELIVKDTCPEYVELDPIKARLAISYVLANATAAAGKTPIQLILSGSPDRFLVEVIVQSPPPASVQSTALSPLSFARLCGSDGERRGMDLSIAARVSEIFGGSARLDVKENHSTTITLEWPRRIPGSPQG